MIFVTVGSMFPFDRLIGAADTWAEANPGEEVLAQIGTGTPPRHMSWVRRMDQDAFTRTVRDAEIVVAHAGMGTVITAGRFGKPLVLLPRDVDLGEHNTSHQVATANWLKSRPGIHVAANTGELAGCIAAARKGPAVSIPTIETEAPPEFIARLRGWINDG